VERVAGVTVLAMPLRLVHPRSIAAACVALCLSACGEAPRERPDIILISLDSVRSDVLNFRNTSTAPVLTALAKRGSVFSNATSGSSWTLPAHVQMLSGSPPSLHGVISDDLRIDPHTALLAEELQRVGYFTAGVFTTGYLWGDYGFDRGFDLYQSAITEADLRLEDGSRLPRGSEATARKFEAEASQGISSPLVARAVGRILDQLETQPVEQPAFLFLHLFDPHYDYIPPEPWDTRFDPDYSGDLDGSKFWTNKRIWDESQFPPRRISERDLQHLIALYRGEVAWTDSQLGLIFEQLERAGRLDNALIIVTADHGEEFFDHGARGHRHTLYDELTRVPLLIVPPRGGSAVADVATQVSLSDLMPTALDYAGVTPPASSDGRTLRTAIEGQPLADRPALSSLYFPSKSANGAQRHRFLHTLRTPTEKLSRTLVLRPGGRLRLNEVAWFDLTTDPLEQNPVHSRSDPRVAAAWERLEAEFARLREQHSRLPRVPDAARASDMRDALFDQLESLGYIEGGGEEDVAPALQLPWGLAPFPAFELTRKTSRRRADRAPREN